MIKDNHNAMMAVRKVSLVMKTQTRESSHCGVVTSGTVSVGLEQLLTESAY